MDPGCSLNIMPLSRQGRIFKDRVVEQLTEVSGIGCNASFTLGYINGPNDRAYTSSYSLFVSRQSSLSIFYQCHFTLLLFCCGIYNTLD